MATGSQGAREGSDMGYDIRINGSDSDGMTLRIIGYKSGNDGVVVVRIYRGEAIQGSVNVSLADLAVLGGIARGM